MVKVTDLTAKTQGFIASDKFLVSKHVTQTSGVLIVGEEYTILDFNTGDNFSNVANVISGTINTTGCVFIATGTNPTTYSNGSKLARYVSQNCTPSDFGGLPKVYKALLTQTGTAAPITTPLVSTLSQTLVWTRPSIGYYLGTATGEFGTGEKLFMPPFNNAEDGVGYNLIPIRGGGSIIGYYGLAYVDANSIELTILDNTFAAVDLVTLIGASRLQIHFEVYP